MEIVDIQDAKCRWSKLLEGVTQGKPFIIAKAGMPIARVVAIDAAEAGQVKRLGFLSGYVSVPDDFDRMDEEEILSQFGPGGESTA